MIGSFAYRWGHAIARHRWPVLGVWLVILIGCALAYPQLSHNLEGPDYNVTGSDSAVVSQLAGRHFTDLGSEQDAIVFTSEHTTADDAGFRKVVDDTLAAVRTSHGVGGVIGPFDMFAQGQISPDRHSAVAVVGLNGDPRSNVTVADDLQKTVVAHGDSTVRASMTGYSPTTNDLATTERADAERGESIGLPVALIVLILALGAVVAGVLPLIAAGVGLLFAFGVIAGLSTFLSFDSMLVVVATMIGTGIGIDYALFVVSRTREELHRRGVTDRGQHEAIAEAVGVGVATAGRTVAVSGTILTIAMCSLLLVNSPVFHEITIGIIATVLCVLLVALTAVPAVLAVLGPWLDRGSVRGLRWPSALRRRRDRDESLAHESKSTSVWRRWAYAVMRRPVLAGTAVVAVLVLAIVPVTGLRYGVDLGTNSLGGTASGDADAVLARDFTPGLMSPIQIVATAPGDRAVGPAGRAAAQRYEAALHADPRIVAVAPRTEDGRQLWLAVPRDPIDSNATIDLVRDLRTQAAAVSGPDLQILVGGATAEFIDLSHETTTTFPWVILAVLALCLGFLAVVFRSIVLPVKAVLMNLLSTGAAVGITVAVFQWGWGETALGFTSVGFLQVYLPITVFVVLFGLSMDYEVFLLGRMKESWDARTLREGREGAVDPARATQRNVEAVADGIEHTAGPITAAALIMIVVFASFISADVLELKEFGVALSVAVLIDAVLVRMILVPALMKLFGRWNWWPGTRIRAHEPAEQAESLTPAGRA